MDNRIEHLKYAKVYWRAISKFNLSFDERYQNLKYQISIGGLGPQYNVILDAPKKDSESCFNISVRYAMEDEDDIRTALQDFLLMLDEYPNQIVPINRDSAAVRLLRQTLGGVGTKCAYCNGAGIVYNKVSEDVGGYSMRHCKYCRSESGEVRTGNIRL